MTDLLSNPTRTEPKLARLEEHQILRMKELCRLLKRSKSMIYLDTNPKSKYYKPDFPKHIKLSERSRGWKAADIYAYIDSLQRKGV